MQSIQIYFWNLLWAQKTMLSWPEVHLGQYLGTEDGQWWRVRRVCSSIPLSLSQTVGRLGGRREKQLGKGLRGRMSCCEGSRVVLVWWSNKERVWEWRMGSAKDGRKYFVVNKTRCADKLWKTLNMGISWYESVEIGARDLSVMTPLTVQVILLIVFWLIFQ